MKRRLHWMWDYIRFTVEFFILRREKPYVLGLITNDTCNLHCIDCRVANVNHSNMPFKEISGHLERYYRKGVRFLYLEGGEPYLWHDGKKRLKDIVALAHQVGYLRVQIYTNGTARLDAHPDFTWISIDGLHESFEKIRGIPLERVLKNLDGFQERHAVVFVINTINYLEIRDFLLYFDRNYPSIKVMFFFHTPYYGIDELFLSDEQRQTVVDTLLACKKEGLGVLNSRVALKDYLSRASELPVNYWCVVDEHGEYSCCRAIGNPEVCKNCGYSTCREILHARNLNPGAVLGMLRTF